jgi:glutathione S-transferase
MKLFYAPGACSIGIHVLMEEIGKPYEGVAVNLREGAQFKPEFTSVNPKSKVPTVVDDAGTVRTEFRRSLIGWRAPIRTPTCCLTGSTSRRRCWS